MIATISHKMAKSTMKAHTSLPPVSPTPTKLATRYHILTLLAAITLINSRPLHLLQLPAINHLLALHKGRIIILKQTPAAKQVILLIHHTHYQVAAKLLTQPHFGTTPRHGSFERLIHITHQILIIAQKIRQRSISSHRLIIGIIFI